MATQKLATISIVVLMIFACIASTTKGDVLNVHCVRPCSDTYDDESCYNDCIQENLGAGFCYPKLPSTDKDCCCNV
ncbi:hypothetical protein Csa_006463 [Cucumis sativus]|uniref:Defensin-like domain-containing protein n=1 Tax=Cucumis sativus TaxID=3659 RepID=A0A0A0LHG9_CUCSA|nr:hypothetical protein Csa_006463 [Cucumis sativus]